MADRKAEEPADVSIVVPTFQGEAFIGRAIESCVREFGSECHGEIVAIDDCSTDNSVAILRGFGADVRILTNDARRGRNASRNRGLEEARGYFVKFLDQDDYLEPGSLAEEISLARRTGADMVVSACRIAPLADGREQIVQPLDPRKGLDALLAGESALTAAVLYRRLYLPGCLWDEGAGKLDDWKFLLSAALKRGRIESRSQIAFTWFQHEHQHSRSHSLLDNARAFYRTLDWLEEELRSAGELSVARERRLAQYRYKELGILGRFDHGAIAAEVARIKSLDPRFVPVDEERRPWMRFLVRLLGLRTALEVYLLGRRWWHGPEKANENQRLDATS